MMKTKRRFIAAAALGLATAAGGLPVRAEEFPAKPIRFIVPFAPGGSVDVLARTLGNQLSQTIGQTVVVENLPGASTNRASDYVARAKPDGYTVLVASDSLVINKSLFSNITFDPETSFTPVTLAITSPQILATHQGSGLTSAAAYFDRAKVQPDSLRVALPGNGVIGHLASELANQQLGGLKVIHVPYNGGAPAAKDLLGGHVDALYITLPAITSHVRDGSLVPLAVTSAKRSSALPQVPTLAETFGRDFDIVSWQGFLVPVGTPAEVVTTLHREITGALRQQTVTASLTNAGFEIVGSTPDAFARTIKADVARFADIVRSAQIKLD